jgi:hypothetical protein
VWLTSLAMLGVGSSLPGLFFGGISRVFSRAHKRWAPMLGVRELEAVELQQKKEITVNDKKGKWHREWCKQLLARSPPPQQDAHAGLFIGEVKDLITMPQMPLTIYPTNRVCGSGVTRSITLRHYFLTFQ